MKKIIVFSALIAILIAPLHTFAMTRIVPIKVSQGLTTTGERWYPAEADGAATVSSTDGVGSPVAVSGTMANLFVNVTAAPGTGNSWKFALYKNGADTGLTCTISDTATSCSDVVDSVALVEGTDLVSWSVTPTGTPAAGNFQASATFAGTNAGEVNAWGATRTNIAIAGFNDFGTFGGTERTTIGDANVYAPTNFTIDKLYIRNNGAVSGGNITVTLYKNGVATALSAALVPGDTTTTIRSDTTHSVSVSTGDLLAIEVTNASGSLRAVRWGMRYTPSIDGEFPLMGAGSTLSTAAVRYVEIAAGIGSNSTESTAQMYMPIASVMKKAAWVINPAPGTGKSWTLVSRLTGGNGNLTGTISDTNSTTTDSVNSDNVSQGTLYNWRSTPSGTPTTVTGLKFSLVSYIAPPAVVSGLVSSQFRVWGGLFKLLGGHFVIR